MAWLQYVLASRDFERLPDVPEKMQAVRALVAVIREELQIAIGWSSCVKVTSSGVRWLQAMSGFNTCRVSPTMFWAEALD